MLCVLSCFSHVQLFATPWTVACQAPLSMAFSRQEYWSRSPCPPPGDLPNPGMEPVSLMSPALPHWLFFTTSTTWEACAGITTVENWLFLIKLNTHQVISLLEGLPTELKTCLQNSVYKHALSNLIHNSTQLEMTIRHTKEWLANCSKFK